MTTWLFCICRNEATLMPYFLRHYAPWVSKLIFWDDQSDDGTRELIDCYPGAALRDWPGTHGTVDDEFRDFANSHWQEAKDQADWVIWVDADEFIYHPQLYLVLSRYLEEGVTVPKIAGYGMVAEHPPTGDGQITDLIKTGFRSPEWDKPVVFQPKAEIAWHVGRHYLWPEKMPVAPVRSPHAELKLLHYRYFGLDYVRARSGRNFDRQPKRCRDHNYGDNNFPDATKPYSVNWFQTFKEQEFPNVI